MFANGFRKSDKRRFIIFSNPDQDMPRTKKHRLFLPENIVLDLLSLIVVCLISNLYRSDESYFLIPILTPPDVTERLLQINPSLAKEARKVLDTNKSERHIRGGMATREKYLHQHG